MSKRRFHKKSDKHFHTFALFVSSVIGSLTAFVVTISLVLASGMYFSFTESWERHVCDILTLLTFMYLFIIQKAQSVESKAIHLKLDELIRALTAARNEVMLAEEKTEEEIDKLKEELIEQTFQDQKI